MTILLLEPAFTAASRTPWGGTRIAYLKRGVGVELGAQVGESWEFSFDPRMPSRVGAQTTLAQAVERTPSLLGAENSRGGSALLVKLLDAAAPLSVQIHPADDFARLASDESGKPESWYVAAAEPGAGIYFGLAPDTTQRAMREALRTGADVSQLLFFVPVAPGDFFLVEAGTAHAIGAGVTLVEPQVVIPGRRGVTYRYWDWNRRYDEAGSLDPKGQARELHVEEALEVTRWEGHRGSALLTNAHTRAPCDTGSKPVLRALCGRDAAPLHSKSLEVWAIYGTGDTELPGHNCMRSLTVLEGEIRADGALVGPGQSAAIGAGGASTTLELAGAHAVLAAAQLPHI